MTEPLQVSLRAKDYLEVKLSPKILKFERSFEFVEMDWFQDNSESGYEGCFKTETTQDCTP